MSNPLEASLAAPPRPAHRLRRVWLRRAPFLLAVLLMWEILAQSGLWPDYIFPAPSEVLRALASGFQVGTYPVGIVGSLGRLIEGYSIATVIGLSLGLLMAQQRWLKETLGMLVMGLQALPSICWLPLALLWFGLNPEAILFVVVMGSELNDMAQVMAVMLVIIVLGLLTDQLVFGALERRVRDRWGLLRR